MRVAYNKDNISQTAEPKNTANAEDRSKKCHMNCSLYITECPHTDHEGNSGLTYTINNDNTHTVKCKYCGFEEKETHTSSDCVCGYTNPNKTVTLNIWGGIKVFTVAEGNSFTLPYSPDEIVSGLVPTDPYYQIKGWKLTGDTQDKTYEAGSDVTVNSDMEFTVVTEPVFTIKTAENIGVDRNEAKAGDIININIEPKFGYGVSKVYYEYITKNDFEGDDIVFGDPMEITAVDGNYQLTMTELPSLANGIIISAEFTKEPNRVLIPDDIENGTVTSDKATANKNDTVTLNVTPDSGYQLYKLRCKTADDSEVELTKADDTTYTFAMPDNDIIVSAEFEGLPQTLTAALAGMEYGSYTVSVNGGAPIAVSGDKSVDIPDVSTGDTVKVTFIPNDNGSVYEFRLEDAEGNGENYESAIQDNAYSFTMPAGNRTIFTRFVALDSVGIIGDVDGDGDVDKIDAVLLLKYISGTHELDENAVRRAKIMDENKDKPDMLDVIAIINKAKIK